MTFRPTTLPLFVVFVHSIYDKIIIGPFIIEHRIDRYSGHSARSNRVSHFTSHIQCVIRGRDIQYQLLRQIKKSQ